MAVIKDLGAVTAYASAVEGGYTGTKEEFETLMASYATVAEEAAESAESASQSATQASASAQTATTKASEASTAAQTATAKAEEAQADADAAALDASQALSAASTATTKASEAAQSASDAATAKTAAQTAQTAAEGSATTAQTAAQTATQKAAEAAESARTLTIDPTLTKSGQAADSKVVGDKIKEVKEDITKASFADLSDADSTTTQRITSVGVPTASSSWTTYWFKNKGYSDIECTVASLGTGDNAVSFFNDETATSETYISGKAILNGINNYSVHVPAGCKLIGISNRTASLESPTASLSLNLAQASYKKIEAIETEVEGLAESIPDTRYIATDADCDFTQACYITASTGVPHDSGSWKSYFFKNKGFTSVDCTVFLGAGDAAIAFYNCKLIAVCNRYSSLSTPTVKLYMPMESMYSKVFELEDEVEALSKNTSIISANKDIAHIISSSSARVGVDYSKVRHKYFSVLHGSDFHADVTNFKRMMEYANANPSNVDCVFATGDFKDHWSESNDGFLLTYGAYYQEAGVPVLPVIGNHEIGYSPSVESVGGVVNSIANIDAKFITPYMTYNGCTQGSGGYYYRDFADYKIRVIALNEYEMPRIVNPNDSTKYLYDYWKRYLSQTQVTWLVNTLSSVPDGYSVIILMHQMPDKITEYTDNKFNSPSSVASDVYDNAQGSLIQDIVDAYIDKSALSRTYANTISAPSSDVPDVTVSADFSSAKGEFIAYIVGHTHYDKVGKSSVASNTQAVIVVTTSGTTKAHFDDLWREEGTKSQDCFNFMVFDTDLKKIRILRVGANTTLNMEWRDMTSISYV